jgi:hypothetical protein
MGQTGKWVDGTWIGSGFPTSSPPPDRQGSGATGARA